MKHIDYLYPNDTVLTIFNSRKNS